MGSEKRLFVLRHAKSSWEDPGLDDHDRPLAPRGRRALKLLAEHVRASEIKPVLVLCSSSRRTQETLEGVDPGGEWLIEPELYSASGQSVIERLRRLPEWAESVMVVGHNPAMQTVVLHLAADSGVATDGAQLEEVRRKFPTGALATLAIDCRWAELGPRCARLISFVRPKVLRQT